MFYFNSEVQIVWRKVKARRMTGKKERGEEGEAVDLIMEGGSWVLINFFWIDSAKWYNLTTDLLSKIYTSYLALFNSI